MVIGGVLPTLRGWGQFTDMSYLSYASTPRDIHWANLQVHSFLLEI